MRGLLALLLACAGAAPAAALPLLPKHPRVARHRVEVGDWRLDVSRNPFSGNVVCRLRDRHGDAVYQQGAVGFRFSRRWDLAKAVYRLDGGAPRAWRDDLPELLRIGTPIDTGGVANPSEGIVWIPVSRLREVNAVAIEPRTDRRPKLFHFRGFRGLYELAVERGCAPDARFVR